MAENKDKGLETYLNKVAEIFNEHKREFDENLASAETGVIEPVGVYEEHHDESVEEFAAMLDEVATDDVNTNAFEFQQSEGNIADPVSYDGIDALYNVDDEPRYADTQVFASDYYVNGTGLDFDPSYGMSEQASDSTSVIAEIIDEDSDNVEDFIEAEIIESMDADADFIDDDMLDDLEDDFEFNDDEFALLLDEEERELDAQIDKLGKLVSDASEFQEQADLDSSVSDSDSGENVEACYPIENEEAVFDVEAEVIDVMPEGIAQAPTLADEMALGEPVDSDYASELEHEENVETADGIVIDESEEAPSTEQAAYDTVPSDVDAADSTESETSASCDNGETEDVAEEQREDESPSHGEQPPTQSAEPSEDSEDSSEADSEAEDGDDFETEEIVPEDVIKDAEEVLGEDLTALAETIDNDTFDPEIASAQAIMSARTFCDDMHYLPGEEEVKVSGLGDADQAYTFAKIPAIYDARGQEICLGDEMAYRNDFYEIGPVIGIGEDCFFTLSLSTDTRKDSYGEREKAQWFLYEKDGTPREFYHYNPDTLERLGALIYNTDYDMDELVSRFRLFASKERRLHEEKRNFGDR